MEINMPRQNLITYILTFLCGALLIGVLGVLLNLFIKHWIGYVIISISGFTFGFLMPPYKVWCK